jgi:hypothetical protein
LTARGHSVHDEIVVGQLEMLVEGREQDLVDTALPIRVVIGFAGLRVERAGGR